MPLDTSLIEWVAEAMAPDGTVTHRKMMGGATLYLDGTIFAIVGDGALYFKADADSDAAWDALGCARFTMQIGDRVGSMNYRRAPDAVYDDADELRRLALLGVAAGQRSPRKAKAAPRRPARAGARRPSRS